MKPNFALNITDAAIALLHRTPRGWLEVGTAAFDSPDLEEALGYLRASALGLSPQGITTKLILPASQVLYMEVEAPGPDKAAREVQIRAALEGRTPYGVDDLVFDWWGKGDKVQVAVVARETLAEAEGFAVAHRFNPVSFVTIPADGQFAGEPWFGVTEAAPGVLPDGEKVTRDQDPVKVIKRDGGKAAPVATEAAVVAVEDSAAADDDALAQAEAEVAAEVAEAERVAEAARQNAEAQADAAKKAEADAAAQAAAQAAAEAGAKAQAQADAARQAAEKAAAQAAADAANQEEEAARQRAEAAKAATELRAQELAQAEAKRLVEDSEKLKAAMAERDTTRAALIEAERKRAAALAAQAEAEAAKPAAGVNGVAVPNVTSPNVTSPNVTGARISDDAAPKTEAATFASRRRDEATAPVVGAVLAAPGAPVRARSLGAATGGAGVTGKPAVTAPSIGGTSAPTERAKTAAPATPTVTSITPARAQAAPQAPAGQANANQAVAAKPLNGTAAFAQGAKPDIGRGQGQANAAQGNGAQGGGVMGVAAGMVAAARIPGKATALSRFKSKVASAPAAQAARGDASMGKMGAKLAPRRGKPRFLGLMLTIALLVALAAVATWSSLYLSRNTVDEPQTIQQAEGGAVVPPQPVDVTPEPEQIAAVPAARPGAEPEAVAETEVVTPASEPASEAAPAAVSDDVATQTAEAQNNTGPQDAIVLAGTDEQPPAFDPVTLPRPQARPDAAPGAVTPPPPFGTQYEFEADGSIKATANGVVMPDGFWLIAARPPTTPPARPAALDVPVVTPEAAVPTTPEASTAEAASTAGIANAPSDTAALGFALDATVEDRRPRGRPAALTPPAVDANTTTEISPADDAAVSPVEVPDVVTPVDPALQQFAGLRPKARSAAIVAAAAQARASEEAAAAAQAAIEAAEAATAQAALVQQASLMAVPASPRPTARPQDLSRSVAAAVAAATRETTRRASTASATAPAPQAKAPEAEEHDDEPELKVSAAPRIPTRANVAKQATFKNAINLSKTNLIGVYGSDGKRYALIRTSSGRYNKVRVGDKVDGGTVAAITRSEVRYQKGGRMLVLAMPNG